MFRLGVIEESLENPDVLALLRPFLFSRLTAQVPGDACPVWHTNEYRVPDDRMAGLPPVLETAVKPTWYIHAFDENELIVVLRGRSFHVSPHKDATWDAMIAYGVSVDVDRRYLENIPLDVNG